MTPYYEHGGITIYHGDCREIAPDLWLFDLMLTDPPYGLGKRMSGGTWGREERYGDMWKWDVAPPAEAVIELAGKARQSIVWGGNYFGLPASRCWLSWSKTNAVHTMASMELAWTTLDRPAKEWRGPVSIHDTGHPTQKPLALMEWCLSLIPEATTIFDPFAGSGTTGVAAKNLNKSAVLVEREERYCEIAAKRLSQEVLPLEASA
jgi:site-specific DNA-methyltransferase (adenine-specific)